MGFLIISIIILRSVESLPNSTLASLHTLIHWSLYASFLCMFHFLEFFSTAVSQPSLLSYECEPYNYSLVILCTIRVELSSPYRIRQIVKRLECHYEPILTKCSSPFSCSAFIINHSPSYTIAAIASWIEFWVEYYIFGGHKLQYYVVFTGLLLVISGQVTLC